MTNLTNKWLNRIQPGIFTVLLWEY
jgi:hypothetical protein